ncbi:mevalonate kinase family protein [Oceanivirga salmonicida]|uniref:mevalonate kinase family protein n=1 Tax=Oceanivirga salmonicida TaxID=1769291 RepID=UPI00082D23EE|nr:hypothetical protein [Oceanivirga salmonicida]
MLYKAPSKIYLAGEYAVLKPNSVAVIACVDKYTYLDLEPSNVEKVISNIDDKHNLLKNARKVAFEYIGEYKTFAYTYTTDLYDKNMKLGLGSSASVVVVTIKALLEHFNISYTKNTLFELSVKAMLLSNMKGSMGDIACICYETLIEYKSIYKDSFKYSIRPINLDKNLEITCIHTGVEASTSKQISKLDIDSDEFNEFCKISDKYTNMYVKALETGNDKLLSLSIENLRKNLFELEKFSNITIHSEKIKEIINNNENCKTSGAGLGDFVVSVKLGEKNEKESTYEVCFRM